MQWHFFEWSCNKMQFYTVQTLIGNDLATPGNAIGIKGARILAGQAARLNADGALAWRRRRAGIGGAAVGRRRETLGRQFVFAQAQFAFIAAVQAGRDGIAGMAFIGIELVAETARGLAGGLVDRAQKDEIAASAGQFAAAKAVAAIGRERAAGLVAGIALHGIELGAGLIGAGRFRVGIVFAGRAVFGLGIVIGRYRMGVAGVIPVAVVVARARVGIEIAIYGASRSGLSRNASIKGAFGVVTGA